MDHDVFGRDRRDRLGGGLSVGEIVLHQEDGDGVMGHAEPNGRRARGSISVTGLFGGVCRRTGGLRRQLGRARRGIIRVR